MLYRKFTEKPARAEVQAVVLSEPYRALAEDGLRLDSVGICAFFARRIWYAVELITWTHKVSSRQPGGCRTQAELEAQYKAYFAQKLNALICHWRWKS